MDVVLHYEDEYLLDWVYQKVSPGVRGVVALLLAPLPCRSAGPGDGIVAAQARELSPLMAYDLRRAQQRHRGGCGNSEALQQSTTAVVLQGFRRSIAACHERV